MRSFLAHRCCTDVRTTAKEAASGFNLFDEGEPSGNVCSLFVQFPFSQLTGTQVPRGFTDMQDVDEQGNVYRGADACYFKAFNDLRTKILENFDEEWPALLQEWDWASTRSYLARADELKFPQAVIDWIEKHKSGTGRYARAVVEVNTFLTVLAESHFNQPFRKCLNPSRSTILGPKSLTGGASKGAAKS